MTEDPATEEGHELALGPRGDRYVLSRTDSEGVTAELELSEVDVMHLARLAANFAREISASIAPAGSDISAVFPLPVRRYETGLDLHGEIVLLRLHDESGLISDFSFEPKTAHEIGATLIAWSERAGNARPSTRQ